jgi:signal transduction histidine kinase
MSENLGIGAPGAGPDGAGVVAASLYQHIADNGQAATGARLVHFAWLDIARHEVRVGAMSGLHSESVQRALAAAGRLVPNFDPLLHVRFPVDVNQWNSSVYAEGRAILTTFEQIVEGTVSPAIAHIARYVAGLRYTFTCPLHRGTEVIGSLAFHFVRAPTEAQQRTCEAFARQAALTLENASLSEQRREIINRMEQLHAEIRSAQMDRLLEHERLRIARELHDQVEQTVFSIGLASQAALETNGPVEDLRACLSTVREYAALGADQLRAAIFALTRAEVPDRGLVPGILTLVQNFRGRTGLEADLVVSGHAGGVPAEIAEVLHAVAREALANVERHAHASAVALHLSVDGRSATLTVQDDGVGAAPVVIRTVAESNAHFGLHDLQARLEQVGGTLAASPGDDGGFVLRASVPLKALFQA